MYQCSLFRRIISCRFVSCLASSVRSQRNHLISYTYLFFTILGDSKFGELRIVEIQNLFPHHISLHYDDSEAGTFLTIIGSNEISKVKVSSGKYILFRTWKLFFALFVLLFFILYPFKSLHSLCRICSIEIYVFVVHFILKNVVSK